MNNKKIEYNKKLKILNINNEKFIIKEKQKNIYSIYNYLDDIGFKNYLPIKSTYKDYDVYPYIEEYNISKNDKAKKLIKTISKLHNKTITYEKINYNELYDGILQKIDYTYKYYYDLQDNIEAKQFMSPAEYLLIRNISSIYSLLYFSKNKIDEWYQLSKKKEKERHVLLNNNLNLSNYIYEKKEYIINWSNAKRGVAVYDFVYFFKHEYLNLDMYSLFKIYQQEFKYTEEEQKLFLSLISIPKIVRLNKTNYLNTINIRNLLLYIKYTHEFISKENEEKQHTYEEKLK